MASDVQIAKWASQAGFRGPQLVLSVAVGLAESGGRTGIYNGSCCYGVWQIHKDHGYSVAEMKNGLANAKMAFKISSGGSNWQPWEAYTNGAYKKYESRAKNAVAKMGGIDPGSIDDAGTGGPVGLEDFSDTAAAVQNVASTVRRLVAGLTDGRVWVRVFLVLGGIMAILAGIAVTATDIGISSKTFSKVAKVIPG